jgi:3-methylcrotonyl-CoA carboxylase beta subunit
MSAQGIAQIAVVMGSVHRRRRLCAGDERRDHHRQEPGHHLPGRPAAGEGRHGEVVSAEDLGGGDVHTRLSGVADHLAQNDLHALALARQAVATSMAQGAAAATLSQPRRAIRTASCTA